MKARISHAEAPQLNKERHLTGQAENAEKNEP